jgi:hypothetical protein
MIGLTKENKNTWDYFVLSCKQGKAASVQSMERREAVLAVAEFVERYQPAPKKVGFENKAIGDLCLYGAIDPPKDYVACIGATVQIGDDVAPQVIQDLTVTRKQLEQLKDAIERFLEN